MAAMVATVGVETRQRARRNKAMAEAEEEKTPPPLAVRMPRQPTPEHPPYCWMIGEAIDALRAEGGLPEDAISSFIRAKHPGVPAAHDRFLRHYLAKHVADGYFVCTAPGRYARCTDEAAAVACLYEEAGVELPVVQVKRGRGRPRKDGSSSTSPVVKKDGSARSGRPARRRRPRRALPLAAGDGTVPASSVVAVADENGSQAAATEPRRRHQVRKLTSSADAPGDALDIPSTTGKEHGRPLELALVVVGDGSVTAPTVDNKVCREASPTTPVGRDEPRELTLVTTTDVPAPTPMVIAVQGSAPTSAAGKKARGKALSATPKAKRHLRPRKLVLEASGAHSAPTPVTGNGAPPVAPKAHGQSSRVYPLTVDEIPDNPSWCLLALPAAPHP